MPSPLRDPNQPQPGGGLLTGGSYPPGQSPLDRASANLRAAGDAIGRGYDWWKQNVINSGGPSMAAAPTPAQPAAAASPSTPSTAPSNPTPGAAAATSSTPAAPAVTQPGAAAPAAGTILRDGNSFSGTNVGQNFQYQDAKTGLRTDPGPMNTMPAANMMALDPALASRLHDAQMAAAGRGEPLAGPGGVGGIRGTALGQSGGSNDILNLAQHGHLTVGGLNAVLGARGQDTNAAIQFGEQGVQQRGQDVQRELGLRGQDVGLLEHQMTAANQRALAKIEQMNKDRQFGLDVAKFGEEKAKTMFAQREQAEAAHNKWVESAFTTTDKDGKAVPDHARIANFNNAVQQSMGSMIQLLQQKGDPTSLAKAQELQSKGLAALDDKDRAYLRTLFLRSERFGQTRGVGPFSASGPVSSDLTKFAITGTDNGMLQKRYTLRGGQSIGQNDVKYTEPANAVLPDTFKTPTTDLGPTADEQADLQRKGLR
jgi:hypothetical protein